MVSLARGPGRLSRCLNFESATFELASHQEISLLPPRRLDRDRDIDMVLMKVKVCIHMKVSERVELNSTCGTTGCFFRFRDFIISFEDSTYETSQKARFPRSK